MDKIFHSARGDFGHSEEKYLDLIIRVNLEWDDGNVLL